jgi:oligopeptidase B
MDFLAITCALSLVTVRRAFLRSGPPIAERRVKIIPVGKVDGENRGGVAAMDPPLLLSDDLHWLRDDTRSSADILSLLNAENEWTRTATASNEPLVTELYDELLSRIQETDEALPYASGPYLYSTRTEAGKAYIMHCRRLKSDSLCVAADVFLDENKLALGHEFCSVSSVEPSPSHKLLAYGIDYDGNETYEIKLMQIGVGGEGGNFLLHDVITETNGDVVWGASDTEFYYSTMDEAHRPNKVWKHVIGTCQKDDILLFTEIDERFWLDISKSRSSSFLFISSSSKLSSEIHALHLIGSDAGQLRVLAPRRDNVLYQVEHSGSGGGEGYFVILSNDKDATNFRISFAPLVGNGDWIEVLPHSTMNYLESIDVFAKCLVISGRSNGNNQIWLSKLPASMQVPLSKSSLPLSLTLTRVPTPDVMYDLTIDPNGNKEYDTATLRYRYSAPRTPLCICEIDFDQALLSESPPTSCIALLKQKHIPNFNPNLYETARIEAIASDGQRIPISIIYRPSAHGLSDPLVSAVGAPWLKPKSSSSSPSLSPFAKPAECVLYAYGSYGHSINMGFKSSVLSLCDRGVIYAVAHVRGGADMGRAWYENGRLNSKKNTFSDFISATEALITQGWTKQGKVACMGASAGGLLVGAVVNLRPDLFGAALSDVGFVDVIHSVADPSVPLAVTEWEEWGNPNIKSAYDYIKTYSPIENVRGIVYPPILLTGGLNDCRVAYWEPLKFAQRLRAATQGDKNSILLKTDMGAGHFSYSDRYVALKDTAFQWAWLLSVLKKKK